MSRIKSAVLVWKSLTMPPYPRRAPSTYWHRGVEAPAAPGGQNNFSSLRDMPLLRPSWVHLTFPPRGLVGCIHPGPNSPLMPHAAAYQG
jgi:hypothetical protein